MRSRYEEEIARCLTRRGLSFVYEPLELTYQQTYTPDFLINGKLIEAKGRLSPGDRAKLIAVKRSNPETQIYLLLQHPERKISKTLTAAAWATKHGFQWARGPAIPKQWLE